MVFFGFDNLNCHTNFLFDLQFYSQKLKHRRNKLVTKNLTIIKGDIRNKSLLEQAIYEKDVVIHLACISNDPSFELNPKLGKSINLDAFTPLVEIAKKNSIKRFIYASTSSVYGIKEEKDVHEKMSLKPITDYSK